MRYALLMSKSNKFYYILYSKENFTCFSAPLAPRCSGCVPGTANRNPSE